MNAENFTKRHGLDSESAEFEPYSRLSGEAKFAEISNRLRNFGLPIVVAIPMVFIDALAIGQNALSDPNPWLIVAVSFYHLYLAYGFTSAIVRLLAGFVYVKRYRYRIDDDGIYVLSGAWFKTHQTLPRNRIQKVTLTQTYIQKHLELATFHAGAVGAGISIEHIPTNRAEHYRETILEQLNNLQALNEDD